MKKILFLILLISFCISLPSLANSIDERLPAKPSKLVNNLSQSSPNFLKPEEQMQLENKLVTFANATGIQIAVLITDDLLDLEPNDYSTRIFNKWGIGEKKTDYGVLILIKPVSPKVIYITTGYGAEGYLPDASVKQIIEKIIKPNFKAEFYYQGLNQATDIMINAFDPNIKKSPKEQSPWALLFLPVFMLLLIMMNELFGSKKSSFTMASHSRRRSNDSLLPFLLGFGAGSIGHRSNDHFGGGFGGGGFGGFGGGMSGGGGAGGNW